MLRSQRGAILTLTPLNRIRKRLLTKLSQASAAVVVPPVAAEDVAAPAAVVAEGMSFRWKPPVSSVMLTCEPSGRGGGRGGAAGGARGGKKVIVEPHRHKGVFVARGGKEDLLATTNLVPGESVYGEKRISVENAGKGDDAVATKTEYRVSTCPSNPPAWQQAR